MTKPEPMQLVFMALLLVLPISALIARRVPVLRVLLNLAAWSAIFLVGIVAFGERERFDPYLGRIARALNLEEQTVVGREVRIRMSPDGHFWARARLDGVDRRMLVDSGATVTALSVTTAEAAGLDLKQSVFPVILNTANGSISARSGTIGELRLGDVVARDLSVVVSPAFGTTDVLGMNFLSRLKSWRVEGNTLILTPHHPRDFT